MTGARNGQRTSLRRSQDWLATLTFVEKILVPRQPPVKMMTCHCIKDTTVLPFPPDPLVKSWPLQGPSKPRDDPPPILLNPIEELPVMQLFQHHLSNFEGSNRKPSDAKGHVRRVSRLLHEVDPQSQCVSLLWHDKSLDCIRNKFFLGNDQAKKPQAPQTLKTYVVSFKSFLKFLLSRKLSVRRIATVTDNDMEEIESALRRLSSWPSSYKVATQKKKAVNRRKDMEEHFDSASFRQLRENKFTEDIQKTLLLSTAMLTKLWTYRPSLTAEIIFSTC